jgi:hypothetical protein
LPIASVFALAGNGFYLVEVGVANTTTTATSMALRQFTAAGTAGTAQTVKNEEDPAAAARANPVDTHTVTPTIVAGSYRNSAIGASVGSGNVWVFGGRGLYVAAGVGNGVGLIPLVAPGQICDVWFVWD